MPTGNLPEGAKQVYLDAEVVAKESTCVDSPDVAECAAKMAWAAVKRKYKKVGDDWVRKADIEFDMTITRASFDKGTGEMRCRAVASDTVEDSYGDSMSIPLFNDFIARINNGEPVPEMYRSDFWEGGMPYVSISHYWDLDGKAVPGEVRSVYVDGNRLKSLIVLDDSPLGRACFRAICDDLYGENPPEEKVRISIGFLDWQHRHKSNSVIFTRNSLDDKCVECFKGNTGLEFLRGQLIHEAFTRVPVNERTSIEVERSDMAKTREEDAASIIGEDLAEEIESESKLVGKSEALVVKSDEDVDETVAESPESEEPEVVEEVEQPAEEQVETSDTVSELEDEADPPAEQKSEALEERAGPTTLQAYFEAEEAREEIWRMNDLWYALNDVVYNIFQDEAIEDKAEAIKGATDEFRSQLAAKAVVLMSEAEESAEVAEAHILDDAFSTFRASYDEVMKSDIPEVERLQAFQGPVDQFVTDLRSSVEQPEVGEDGDANDSGRIAQLEKSMTQVGSDISMIKELLTTGQTSHSAAPERRSIAVDPLNPGANSREKPAPNSIRGIAERSVGLG